ncbi:MAG: hypothetical protein KAH21_12240, partial [Spirochaetaceae bacterium]|nr:hypothetical protein [Spirochaetaceae bacterium]
MGSWILIAAVSALMRVSLPTSGVVGLIWLVNLEMLGTGKDFLQKLFDYPSIVSGNLGKSLPLALAALFMVLARSFSVGLTVGSGQSAGFFGPLAQIGMLLGTFTAIL